MKEGEFSDLFKEENDQNLNRVIVNKVKNLMHSTDIEHVAQNWIGKIGNPVVYEMNVNLGNANNYKINYNVHDYDDIYHLWFIVNQLNHLGQEHPIICGDRVWVWRLGIKDKI